MDIELNGEPFSVPEGSTLLDLLAVRGIDPASVVVEVNRAKIVRNGEYGGCRVAAADRIEVLRFVGGG
jgi:thiamine biosynthesis protein ThiS